MIGATVDQFKIAKLLEKTPVGETFLAVHSQTGAHYVLQSISPQLVSRAGFRKSFLDDASKLIKFEHPNLVPLVNVLEESGRLYLVREYFEGLSMAEMLKSQSGRLSLEGVVRLFKDVLRGVGYFHAEGAVHRFLNPKNIQVTSDGDAKILGLGEVLPGVEERLMPPDEKAYAARYFSPERIRNPNTTDIRANIYALGAVLFELSTGSPPFLGSSFEEQAKAHIEQPVPDPRLKNPSLPPALGTTILRALEKRPEDRFQNSIEFYKAMEQAENQLKNQQGQMGTMGRALVDSPDPGFQFDLPSEAQEDDFNFDLGSKETPVPASDIVDFGSSLGKKGNDFQDQFGDDDADPFSAANLASGNTSLDFSGFARNDSEGGLFDLDLAKGTSGGVLDFSPGVDDTNPSQPQNDLDRLSFGQTSKGSGDAFDLGLLDAHSGIGGNDFEDETLQEAPEPLRKAKNELNFGSGSGALPPIHEGVSKPKKPASDPFFDFGNEFPSESPGEKDPFASLSDSSPDIDLSFKGGELDLGLGPSEGSLELENHNLFSSPASEGPSSGRDSDFGFENNPPQDRTVPGFEEEDPFTSSVGASAESERPFGDFDIDDIEDEEGIDSPVMAMPARNPEAADFMSQSPTLEDDIHKEGLEESLAKIEAADAAAKADSKSEKVRVKKVRKIDKKLLGLTVGLAAVVVLAFFYWMNQQRQKRSQEQAIDEIQQLVSQRQYNAALSKISDFMGTGSAGRFDDLLSDIQRQIRSEQRQTKEQIETLTERAANYEIQDLLLEDGKNDAYSTYHTILSLDPSNKKAKESADRIRELHLAKAVSLLESDQKVEALGIYAALTEGNRADGDTHKKYQALKDELKESRAGALVAEVETLYNQKKYDQIQPVFKQLSQIDPKSEFVTRMRRTLVGELVSQSKEMLALRNYEKAEDFLKNAKKLDPENKKVGDLLAEMGEERLRGDIEAMARELANAITGKDYAKQHRLSTELLEIDPGNRTAISALDGVKAFVNSLTQKGEEMREVGNFKGAAGVYRQIYLIDKSEQARALWSKYDNWTPPQGMAYVPEGNFRMGSRETRDARPVQDVFIASFFIDQKEVTNREFKAFVDTNPKWQPGRINASLHDGNYLKHWHNGAPIADDLDRPVTHVSWFAASAYASFQNKRLPTEAEWEKAAAGNTTGKKYWWGNYSDAKMAVYEFYKEKLPAAVGSFPPNGYGIYEILGNVNEWTQDSYDPGFYSTLKDARNPVNADASRPERVFRGGSFRSRGQDLVLYLRSFGDPKYCHATLGFRCAMDSKKF